MHENATEHNFPRLSNITELRVFQGLVNKTWINEIGTMEAFKNLLKKETHFLWTDEMEQEFTNAKSSIVDEDKRGETLYQLDKWTAIVTDWCIKGK